MAQFQEQGGAATMDPGRLRRWATSRLMTRVGAESRLLNKRERLEAQRVKRGEPHRVEYFHQVDDGYSHLAAQQLAALKERYAIELDCHLVSGPSGKNSPEPELLATLSRYDAQCIASGYGLAFPDVTQNPPESLVARAGACLAALDRDAFVEQAAAVGHALWSNDDQSLEALATTFGTADAQDAIARGNARREELGHYSGAMFYYAGEWYWGVDRLYHLEKRLAQLGADRRPEEALLMPRPAIETGPGKDNGSLTLEIYPSLRSPYTAISFDRAVALARATGVKLVVRPVLPMVMRGVPATRQKGMYIFMDAAREAREAGVAYGNFYDPIGEPVRQAYSLYPWARERGGDIALISAFLKCAFAEGVNTLPLGGLRQVVEAAGLDWAEAREHLGNRAWEEELERNRQAMYDCGLWGVPSFRLLDAQGEQRLALWGQDRLWVVSREIQALLAGR